MNACAPIKVPRSRRLVVCVLFIRARKIIAFQARHNFSRASGSKLQTCASRLTFMHNADKTAMCQPHESIHAAAKEKRLPQFPKHSYPYSSSLTRQLFSRIKHSGSHRNSLAANGTSLVLYAFFMHWPFLSLKRVLFLKIWRISSLKRQLKLVYSIVLMLKRQLQRVDGVVLILKRLLQLVCCHFLNLFLPWKLNIYAISTLKRLKKQVSGLVSNLKRGKILVEIAVLNLKHAKFLKLHGKSILKNVRQQELCPVLKLFLSWNCINIQFEKWTLPSYLCRINE